jgi:hypothetical protein
VSGLRMDLHTVTKVHRPASVDEIDGWDRGCTWLAGGTWLFSEPQPQTRTLIDIDSWNEAQLNHLPCERAPDVPGADD